MPRHHNAEVVNRLRRFMGSRGPLAIDTIAPELVPVVIAADASREQAAALERFCMGYVSRAAVSAEFAHTVLMNPATSRVDVLLHQVLIGVGATQYVQAGFIGESNISGYDGSDTGLVTDIPGVNNYGAGVTEPNAKLYADSLAAVEPAARFSCYIRVVADWSYQLDLAVRLEPGFGWIVANNSSNQLQRTTFHWREVDRVQ